MKELNIKEETMIGMPIEPIQCLAETAGQKAVRDFWYQFSKSIGVLWLVSKIPSLDYKDWVKIRIEQEDWEKKNGKERV